MSKLITIPKDFAQADGTPFQTAKRDKENKLVLQKGPDGKSLLGPDGSPYVEMRNADFTELLRNFLNGIFRLAEQKKAAAIQEKQEIKPQWDMAMEDSAFATDIFRAISVASDGVIELEKSPHEWLLKQIAVWGMEVFGVNAAIFKEPIENGQEGQSSRGERRREEKRERNVKKPTEKEG